MALSSSALAGLIEANITAAFGAPANEAELAKWCNAVASAIVTHITTSAVVPPGINLNIGAAVTSGPGQVT